MCRAGEKNCRQDMDGKHSFGIECQGVVLFYNTHWLRVIAAKVGSKLHICIIQINSLLNQQIEAMQCTSTAITYFHSYHTDRPNSLRLYSKANFGNLPWFTIVIVLARSILHANCCPTHSHTHSKWQSELIN